MLITPAATANNGVTRPRVPALPTNPALEAREMGLGTGASVLGTHTPAFAKDVSGVRAWSPPV